MNNFTLLEQKIRKVTDLIQSLQKERSTLAQKLETSETEVEALHQRQQTARTHQEENQRLRREVQRFETEREELRSRVQRMRAGPSPHRGLAWGTRIDLRIQTNVAGAASAPRVQPSE